jgi:type II secretory pathway pseudopilin PulG
LNFLRHAFSLFPILPPAHVLQVPTELFCPFTDIFCHCQHRDASIFCELSFTDSLMADPDLLFHLLTYSSHLYDKNSDLIAGRSATDSFHSDTLDHRHPKQKSTITPSHTRTPTYSASLTARVSRGEQPSLSSSDFLSPSVSASVTTTPTQLLKQEIFSVYKPKALQDGANENDSMFGKMGLSSTTGPLVIGCLSLAAIVLVLTALSYRNKRRQNRASNAQNKKSEDALRDSQQGFPTLESVLVDGFAEGSADGRRNDSCTPTALPPTRRGSSKLTYRPRSRAPSTPSTGTGSVSLPRSTSPEAGIAPNNVVTPPVLAPQPVVNAKKAEFIEYIKRLQGNDAAIGELWEQLRELGERAVVGPPTLHTEADVWRTIVPSPQYTESPRFDPDLERVTAWLTV